MFLIRSLSRTVAKYNLEGSEEAEPEMLPEEIPVVVLAAVILKTLKFFGFVYIFTSFLKNMF